MLSDREQRLRATDPSQSFLVQAPAGSGKTEILTQRYLRLLNQVDAPEQILAITFTRKAANEMRERILLSLRKAAANETPASEHHKLTFDYAKAALKKNQQLNWQLIENPNRMGIFTIDALCQKIINSIPLHEKNIPFAQISELAEKHYLTAARACLHYAISEKTYHPHIKSLLQHLDNNQEKLVALFSELLSKREQWLVALYQAKLQEKSEFEKALALIEKHEIRRFYESIPKDCIDDLFRLSRRVAFLDENPESPRQSLKEWMAFEKITPTQINSLAGMLLTSQNSLRKGFDHHVGLKKGVCSDLEFQELRTASKALLSKLEESKEFIAALLRVKDLPPPQYNLSDWEVLQALFIMLPLLTAYLHLVFEEHNEVDFTEVSQQALSALEQDGEPTDLALYWDNQINHLLVDEFQDTSISQFELLVRLTQGWESDGRTLFLVGDPMQSIYRFRSAEVGLFLRTKKYGLGPILPTFLELSSNFRSSAPIVDWVNHQFPHIFPKFDDIESGAVSFNPGMVTRPENLQSFTNAFCYVDQKQEARGVLECVKKELEEHPLAKIAILVRSRTQLREIVPLLREASIPFQGVDIDLLSSLPHLKDVWACTQALLKPVNRLVWLSLLRSPWCGMNLNDILCVANFDKNKSIYHALTHAEKIEGLSQEGVRRAHFIYSVFSIAFATRCQKNCLEWIDDTLNALHLDYILNPMQRQDLEQYWLLLEKFEKKGQLENLDLFEKEFNSLYSKKVTQSSLQIMTIHKSKGLEFDCVILPGLSGKVVNRDKPLMRWLKLPNEEKELLLLSPIKSIEEESCLLYDYLGKLEAQKNNYELQRLLYVAATRAKHRLYLFDYQEKASEGSFRSLLKNQEFSFINIEEQEGLRKENYLEHLPIDFYLQPPLSDNSSSIIAMENNANFNRLYGIASHELLQWICDYHPENINEIPFDFFNYYLKTMGVNAEKQEEALALIKRQIEILFLCPIGQWLIKYHAEEQNEFEILLQEEGIIKTRIIDRTFVDKGNRWVIDFKTGNEAEGTVEKHKHQVNEYAFYLTKLYQQPIHCGIYYLSTNHWITWKFATVVERNKSV